MSNSSQLTSRELEMAKEAVTEKLKLDGPDSSGQDTFIQKHQEEIFDKLEHLYTNEERDHEFAFIAASLPLISGVIHVGSKVDDYREATRWIKEDKNMPNADPASVLSALTFIYLVDRGVDECKKIDSSIETKIKEMLKAINRIQYENQETNKNLDLIRKDLDQLINKTTENKEEKKLEEIFKANNEENLYEEILNKLGEDPDQRKKIESSLHKKITAMVEKIKEKISKNQETNKNLDLIQKDLNHLLNDTDGNNEEKKLNDIFRDQTELHDEINQRLEEKKKQWDNMNELVNRILRPANPQN